MPNPHPTFIDQLRDFLDDAMLPILIAAFGGFVGVLNKETNKGMTGRWALTGLTTAGFVGLIVASFLAHTTLPQNVQTAIVAVAGYSSNDVLKVLRDRLLQAVADYHYNVASRKTAGRVQVEDEDEEGRGGGEGIHHVEKSDDSRAEKDSEGYRD